MAEPDTVRAFGRPHCELGHRLDAAAGGHDGIFARWAFDADRLVVETDRYGMYPLFVHVAEHTIIVSPSIVTLLELGAPRDLDLDALAVFLHIGFFLRDETPFRAVRALPPGGRLAWTRDGVTISGDRIVTPTMVIERRAAIDAYVDLFRQAIQRRPPRGRVALPLSGGRDSRHILLQLAAAGTTPDACVTARFFPPRPDEDAAVASHVAAAVGVPHVVLAQGDELEAEARKNVTTGFCADEHAWFGVVAEYLGRGFDTVYDGIGGDVLSAGLYLNPERVEAYTRGRYDAVASCFMMPRSAATLTLLLTAGMRAQLSAARARERVAAELATHAEAGNPIGSFCFWNRTRREIALAPYRMGPEAATVYAPYLDHDLYDFLAALPAALLVDRTFHTETIGRAFPEHVTLAYERDASYPPARTHDRRFTTALLTSGRLQHEGSGRLLAPGITRRLRIANVLDGLRTEQAQLQPRLALYLVQLETLVGSVTLPPAPASELNLSLPFRSGEST